MLGAWGSELGLGAWRKCHGGIETSVRFCHVSAPVTHETTVVEMLLHGPALAITTSMDHDIGERAFRLALSIVTMRDDPWFREMVQRDLLRQLVRAGTSVGSNLSEASAAQTKPDFIAKASIAKKEIFETQFWLRLGAESSVLTGQESTPLRAEAATVGRIISTIVRKAKSNDGRG